MSSDHIWPILFFVSLAGNLILLFYRPLLRLLRRGCLLYTSDAADE